MFAKVIVDINIPTLDRLFDYIIPQEDIETLKIGMRVIVPFGFQTRLGYVIDITEESDKANKEIIEVLDVYPSIDLEQFKYIEYLKENNRSSLIDILETILPKEIFLKYYQQISIIGNVNEISQGLLEFLNLNGPTRYTRTLKEHRLEIDRLVRNNILKIEREYEQKAKIKYENTITFNKDNNYGRISNYESLVNFVISNPGLTRAKIVSNDFSLSSVNTLIKNNAFKVTKTIANRDANFIDTKLIPAHILNKEQENAFKIIKKSFNTKDEFLLKGITGSGKTEVYMQLMKEVIKEEKNILYLVPEIALVAPLVQNLKSRFREKIVHYNSSLSSGERYDSYRSIINNEARIIVGTRSSVFLPINKLGLIIVDEEQDSSYSQVNTKVQYELIDILRIKANYFNAPIILGSATPKVATMYEALNKDIKLLELTKRATNQPLPKVEMVDMKEELKKGNSTIFSTILHNEINDRLNKNEQIILLYNRKGYSSFTMCRTCSYTPKCKNCDISLTYYKSSDDLRCSYCNYKEPNLKTCPSCNKETIRPIGLGIDQITEITKRTFPDAKVIQMDSNATSKKGSHEKIWLDFNNQKYDILVGTKMVSKGMDFPKVTLVGILMADLELKAPTYLATEETYSLLTQMVGRSGRHQLGTSVIQGYDLDNYAIRSVKTNYEDFYKEAIFQRQITKYAPFYEVSQLLIKNKSYLAAYQDALRIKKELEKDFEIVLGPSEPIIKFIKNEYRFIITIKDKKINVKKVYKIIDYENKDSNVEYYNNPTLI